MSQAEEAMRSYGAEAVGEEDGLQRGFATYPSGLVVQSNVGPGDVVNAVEVSPPQQSLPVVYDGIDLFAIPATDVRCLLEQRVVVEEDEGDEGGCSVIAPELLLALWRPFITDIPEDVEGYYFQSALVAQPGYYD